MFPSPVTKPPCCLPFAFVVFFALFWSEADAGSAVQCSGAESQLWSLTAWH